MEPLEGYSHDAELFGAVNAGIHGKVRNLQVLKNCEEVVIIGTCSSFHIKQMAQESIRNKLNGLRMKNAIIVKPD